MKEREQSERSVRGEALTGLSLSDTRCDWISMKRNTWENDTERNELKDPPDSQTPSKKTEKREAGGLSRQKRNQKQVIELKERKSLIFSDSDRVIPWHKQNKIYHFTNIFWLRKSCSDDRGDEHKTSVWVKAKRKVDSSVFYLLLLLCIYQTESWKD